MISEVTHDKFVFELVLPLGLTQHKLLTAFNRMIIETAHENGIDLGGSLNWETRTTQLYGWNGKSLQEQDENRVRRGY